MEYLSKKKVKPYKEQFNEIISQVRSSLGNQWKFTLKLVGSAKRNLVLEGQKGFDLDYQIILSKYPNNYEEEDIKKEFKTHFDKVLPFYGMNCCEDSTHVLTTKYIEDDKLLYSYDIAIMKRSKNGGILILKNEKDDGNNGPYHYVTVPCSKRYKEKFKQIYGAKMWNELRERYKDKKEDQEYLSKVKKKHSLALLAEAVNEMNL